MESAPLTDLEAEMQRRIRRHMLTALGGLGTALAGGVIAARLFGSDPQMRLPLAICVAVCLAMVPAVGFRSTVRNLRCPACEQGVGFQVSANMSIYAARASKTCRHCGKKIFRDAPPGSFRRMTIAIVVGSLVLFGVVMIAQLLLHQG